MNYDVAPAKIPRAYYKTIKAQAINSSLGTQMSGEFRGLTYAPSYEDEVIMLFGMMMPHMDQLGDSFEIEEYSDEFPDCIAKMDGELVGIEFELKASNFKNQHHNLSLRLPDCKYLICWKNDTGKDSLSFPYQENQTVEIKIIELKKELELLEKKGFRFILNPEKPKRPVSKWEKETFLKQLRKNVENRKVTDNEYNLIEELLALCEKNKKLEVVYGVGKNATFSVRVKKWGKATPLYAEANGSVFISFKDWSWVYPSPEIEDKLRRIFSQPTKFYKKFRIRDNATFNKIKEALEWLAEA